MSGAGGDRDRDAGGRARNARSRDALGRPLDRRTTAPPAEDGPLPPAAAIARAQELLDAGQAFTAHEVFEAVWKATAGPEHELWRGLAQLCVGITHALRGNATGASRLLERGATALAPFAASPPHSLDVAGIRRWATAAAADLTLVAEPPRLVDS
jgi:hypothetical protein